MGDLWTAATRGDLGEVLRLVGQDPALLDAQDRAEWTPLTCAAAAGHIDMVRWLVDQGADIDKRGHHGFTPLCIASCNGRLPVVRWLLEKGADPAIATHFLLMTPLMAASHGGHVDVMRLLLGHPIGKTTTNHRCFHGRTALWTACFRGKAGAARVLLESGADSHIASTIGVTPMAIAKEEPHIDGITAEGRRECVAALEVRL
jgi:ankyrin repeat protein